MTAHESPSAAHPRVNTHPDASNGAVANGARARRIASAAHRIRRGAGAAVVDNFFRAISFVGQLHPDAKPERHGLTLTRDIPYRATGRRAHLLDVYRPADRTGPLPTVLYIHGGGFRILSKDTHWVMGLAFARAGYVVFNVNYRLAPRHPFPAAVDDVSHALEWIARHAPEYGADLDRLVFAGESAGANLATSLAIATSYRRPEPFARRAWDTGLRARAVVPACGILQTTDPERFLRRKPTLNPVVFDRIVETSEAYVGRNATPSEELDLADPIRVLERGAPPDRPLPAFFAPVGTRDPVLDDTRRLKTALDRLGVECEARYYQGEPHAFHAVVFLRNARRCWLHTYAFLERALEIGTTE